MPSEELEQNTVQANWYYVGHYGQLGPLTLEQMADLARDGVIDRETYVWKEGMSDWVKASTVRDLSVNFGQADVVPPAFGVSRPLGSPPPMPGSSPVPPHQPTGFQPGPMMGQIPMTTVTTSTFGFYMTPISVPQSDKSRVGAGILGLVIPGAGRFYLGYAAHGALQFLLSFCGIGFLWSWVDSIYILCGGVKYDGYGRTLD
jgi:TM2 domain-containing membrane protein YozV